MATKRPFVDSVDQDQTAHSVQSDLGSTLSNKEMFLFQNINFEMVKYAVL